MRVLSLIIIGVMIITGSSLFWTDPGYSKTSRVKQSGKNTVKLASKEKDEKSVSKNKTESKPAIYKIQSRLKKLENLEVDFVQKIYTPLRNKTRIVEGKAYFSYPNKFKWVRKKPVKEEIFYNGTTLVIYKPDEKTAMKLSGSSDRNQEVENITDMILDTATLLEKYKVIESRLDDTTIFLKLFPKEEDSNVTDIYITIDTVKNYVDNLKIYYVDKKNWEFSFKNPSTKKLPESTFKFRTPKGVKITSDL